MTLFFLSFFFGVLRFRFVSREPSKKKRSHHHHHHRHRRTRRRETNAFESTTPLFFVQKRESRSTIRIIPLCFFERKTKRDHLYTLISSRKKTRERERDFIHHGAAGERPIFERDDENVRAQSRERLGVDDDEIVPLPEPPNATTTKKSDDDRERRL